MKKSDIIVAIVLGLVVVVAVIYFQPQEEELQVLDLPPEIDVQQTAAERQEPTIRYPVPKQPLQEHHKATESTEAETTVAEPKPRSQQEEPTEEVVETVPEKTLPTLSNSDAPLRQDLYTLAASQVLDSLFNLNRIIQRFVVTVDNLPRKQLLRSKHRSNQAVRGQLIVEKDDSGLYLSEKNFTRYDGFVNLLDNINNDQLIALYLHYYPLIQPAYENLGYPSAYFNDRLVDVIDHLLEAPSIGGRVSLVRPRVLYKYADPELESLSAGQKVLIRIGSENAARVKSKLRELRLMLVVT